MGWSWFQETSIIMEQSLGYKTTLGSGLQEKNSASQEMIQTPHCLQTFWCTIAQGGQSSPLAWSHWTT